MKRAKSRCWKSMFLCLGVLSAIPLVVTGCAVSGYEHLPSEQQDSVRRAQDYLNSLTSLKADFAQEGPGQQQGDGRFLYAPKSLKMAYALPQGMTLVARNGHLTLNDPSTGAVTKISLKRNPLGFLLRHPLRFSDGIQVTNVTRGNDSLQVSLTQADNPSQGLLTLQFSDVHGHLSLIGLQGVDARQRHFGLSLFNVQEETSEPNDSASPSSSSQ